MLNVTNNSTQQINAALNALDKKVDNISKNIKVETTESKESISVQKPLSIKNNIISLDTNGYWKGTADSAENDSLGRNISETYLKNSEKGSVNGIAPLNEEGRINYEYLPESAMEFKGSWNAETNTPTLTQGEGTNGDFYVVSNPGIWDNTFFEENDRIIFDGGINKWIRLQGGNLGSYLKVDGTNGTHSGVSALINKLSIGDSDPVDNDYYVSQYVNGGTSNTLYYRRPISKLWNYTKSKIQNILGLTSTEYNGNSKTASKIKDYNDTSNEISIGYKGVGLTSTNYFAAYDVSDGSTKIKDISVAETLKVLDTSARKRYGHTDGQIKYFQVSSTDSFSGILVSTGYYGNLWFETQKEDPVWLGNADNIYGILGWAWSSDGKTLYIKANSWRPIAVTVPSYRQDQITFSNYSTTAPSDITFTDLPKVISTNETVSALSNKSATGSETGYATITLPGWDNVMVTMKVDVYNYDANNNSVATYTIGGYPYQDQKWYNSSCFISGGKLIDDKTLVYVGAYGGKPVIQIGQPSTTWSYPQIKIRDIQIGYTTSTSTKKKWLNPKNYSVTFSTTALTNFTLVHNKTTIDVRTAKQNMSGNTLGGSISLGNKTVSEVLTSCSQFAGLTSGSFYNTAASGDLAGSLWVNFMYVPHRDGVGGDNTEFGTLYLTYLTQNTDEVFIAHRIAGTNYSPKRLPSTAASNFDVCHPIGEVYVQFPTQKDPNELYGRGKWTDITSTYAGLFFRAAGGNASTFGTSSVVTQNEELPNVKGSMTNVHFNPSSSASGALSQSAQVDAWNKSGTSQQFTSVHTVSLDASKMTNSVYKDNGHVTPVNTAIKIWKRTE